MDFKYFEEIDKCLLSIDIVDIQYIIFFKYGFSMLKAIIFWRSIFFVSSGSSTSFLKSRVIKCVLLSKQKMNNSFLYTKDTLKFVSRDPTPGTNTATEMRLKERVINLHVFRFGYKFSNTLYHYHT